MKTNKKLLAFIRSSKDSIKEDKPKAIVPTPQAPKKAPKTDKVKKSKRFFRTEN